MEIKTYRVDILFVIVILFTCFSCEVEQGETYYLTDNELEFCPYSINEQFLMTCNHDTVIFKVKVDTTEIVAFWQAGFNHNYEERLIELKSDTNAIRIRLNKFGNKFNLYIDFGNFNLDKDLFELESFYSNGLVLHIGDTMINRIVYSNVYLLKSGGSSVGGVGLDSLYYNSQHGLIKLKSLNKVYRFKY